MALGLGKFAHRAKKESQRGVGDLFGEHIGRIGDGDTVRARPRRIHMVVADAERGDELETWEVSHEGAVDALRGGRNRHATHPRPDFGEELIAVFGFEELDELEYGIESIEDDWPRRSDQQH